MIRANFGGSAAAAQKRSPIVDFLAFRRTLVVDSSEPAHVPRAYDRIDDHRHKKDNGQGPMGVNKKHQQACHTDGSRYQRTELIQDVNEMWANRPLTRFQLVIVRTAFEGTQRNADRLTGYVTLDSATNPLIYYRGEIPGAFRVGAPYKQSSRERCKPRKDAGPPVSRTVAHDIDKPRHPPHYDWCGESGHNVTQNEQRGFECRVPPENSNQVAEAVEPGP